MQGIYNYVPETNHVSRVYTVAAILLLPLVLHVMLFPMFNILYFCFSSYSILLEKQTGFQLVKKFPAFYGSRRSITAFASARHLSLS